MKHLLFLVATLALVGCKSDKPAGGSGLAMSSSSAACKKAMTCCELSVKAQKGTATPEDINLSCSGVALAKTDADCNLFRDGYVGVFTAKELEIPAECK